MSKPTDHRRDLRVRTAFETLYAAGRKEGAGRLADISYHGARVEVDNAASLPPIGSTVRLYVFLQPVSPFEIEGEVVRHGESGFAMEYKEVDPELRHLVDDAAALVSPPSD